MELKNGSITMATGKNTINIDATNGIVIKKGTDKTFYLDTNGNIVMKGNITAQSGNIGGFTIGSSALYNGKDSLVGTANGVYLGTDGISIGSKTITIRTYNGNSYTTKTQTIPAFGADTEGTVVCDKIIFGNASYITSSEFYDWWRIDDDTATGATCWAVRMPYLSTNGICIGSNKAISGNFEDADSNYCGYIGLDSRGIEMRIRTPPAVSNGFLSLITGNTYISVSADSIEKLNDDSVSCISSSYRMAIKGGSSRHDSSTNIYLMDKYFIVTPAEETNPSRPYTYSYFKSMFNGRTGFVFCDDGLWFYGYIDGQYTCDKFVLESSLSRDCFV